MNLKPQTTIQMILDIRKLDDEDLEGPTRIVADEKVILCPYKFLISHRVSVKTRWNTIVEDLKKEWMTLKEMFDLLGHESRLMFSFAHYSKTLLGAYQNTAHGLKDFVE